ncbi:hypothetical protein Mal15_55160 [Stieleria maiorica]|uniref:Uncharacterized protein n=1 Tax=Stieleria maiorica TaxID=2795974 RepID=A0A5B9MM04_9BACT|nr:hypothetical protein Mal15_55160 [Stieleria maiorica]
MRMPVSLVCCAIDYSMPHEPQRFFVMPPGIWVDDVDQIMDVWDGKIGAGR